MHHSDFSFSLAIIIPYYKQDFIRETLFSIQQQTDKRFILYIGDDNSPYPLQPYLHELEQEFIDRIYYKRFADNMGSISLTKQWERCIGLTNKEPYIWLFSDDDVMPVDAVERFYSVIDKENSNKLYRFDIEIIDGKGAIIRKAVPHPFFETAEHFIRRRLAGTCISTACEYIFLRNVYNAKNGFIDLPLAWAADDATWTFFAEESGILTIPGKPISWRMSGRNISSDMDASYQLKISASILFVHLISEKFSITNKEKITWLQHQLYLLKPTLTKKKEFYKATLTSGLFTRTFLVCFLIRQGFLNFWKRMDQKIKNIIKT